MGALTRFSERSKLQVRAACFKPVGDPLVGNEAGQHHLEGTGDADVVGGEVVNASGDG